MPYADKRWPRRGGDVRPRPAELNPTRGRNPMPRNLRRSQRSRNCAYNLCLFTWADTRPQARTTRSLAVRHIQRRARCTTSTAALYAVLAGFPTDGDA